ncbi:hypothetical protein BU17DRAFT_86976 [Hysterangium stoloniferum]|nr:hypothetical protein BU17DRAFT_86976 [Hysterangium stoloniferum]
MDSMASAYDGAHREASHASTTVPSRTQFHLPIKEQDVFVDGEVERELDPGPSDVFGRQMHSSRIRWTTEMDELFYPLKESVDLYADWEEAQPAATPPDSEALTQVQPQSGSAPHAQQQPESRSQQQPQTQPQPQQMSIPPPIYSLLLTYLMRKMRISHRNPAVSQATSSVAAYNELRRARWATEGLGTAAADNEGLKGVESVLREMKVNGVGFDSSTRAFVEDVRRDVGRTGMGSGVKMEMEMENRVVARSGSGRAAVGGLRLKRLWDWTFMRTKIEER